MIEEPWESRGPLPHRGILSVPEPRPPCGSGTIVLLLSAGNLSRIGPHRFYVRLARRLAERGFYVLRFDLFGIGDSKSRARDRPSRSGWTDEMRAVLDDLGATADFHRFVLFGMCHSVGPAFELAIGDPRVTHGIFANGDYLPGQTIRSHFPHVNNRIRWRYYVRQFTTGESWRRLLSGRSDYGSILAALTARLPKLLSRKKADHDTPDTDTLWYRLEHASLDALMIYSDGSPSFDVFETVHEPVLLQRPALPNLSIETVSRADHTLTLCWSQNYVIDVVERWLTSRPGLRETATS